MTTLDVRPDAIDLIRRIDGTNLNIRRAAYLFAGKPYVGKHRLDLDPLCAQLEKLVDKVTRVDRAPAEDCASCPDEPVRPADVEIYTIAGPGADEEHERMCHVCALDELPKRPRGERVRIEVCTG